MKRAACLLALLPLILSAAESDRAARWREDLQQLDERFPALQVDFAKIYNAAAFHTEIQALQSSIGDLSDAEITLRLTRLIAAGNVAHTRVNWPLFGPFRRLPLGLRWYADGLAVTQAAPEYSAALGARVLRIGSMTAEQVLASAAPYISHENESFLRSDFNSGSLTVLELLQQIGAAPRGEDVRVEFTLAKPSGEPFTLSVRHGDPRAWSMNNLFDRKNRNRSYWFEYLAENKAIYLQYNRCQDDPEQPFAKFTQDVAASVATNSVDRIVIDLRFNGGGNSAVLRPLIDFLKLQKTLRHHVYVLVSRNTFSSALMNAIELRRQFHAVWVGEEPGEKPNSYGEVRPLKLPNSGLTIQYCTRYFRLAKADEVHPDVPVSPTLEDVLANRDPVLAAALRR